MNKILCLLFILLLTGTLYADEVQNMDYKNDNINLYTTWDEDFLYIACEAQTPRVNGIHKEFNKPVTGDDGIEVVVEMDNKHSNKITPACFSFAASAAGGFEFKKGNDKGEFVHEDIFSHKMAVDVVGTLNNNSDIDNGVVFEFAIPWNKITDANPANTTLSFNFKVTLSGKDYYLTSEKDFYNPSTWYDLILTKYINTFVARGNRKIMSGRYFTNAPVSDGEIKDGEWNKKTFVNIKIPIDGESIYKLKFSSQRFIEKELVLNPSNNILSDINRVDVIKSEIDKLKPCDILYVNVDDNLLNIVEALNNIRNEKGEIYAIAPKITSTGTEDFIVKLDKFLRCVPNQYRYIIPSEDIERSLVVYSNDNIDINKINEYYKSAAFKVLVKNSLTNERINSEYSYVITNYDIPTNLPINTLVQSSFVIKNTGTITWKPLEMSLSYRWFKNDRFYSQGVGNIPITSEVKPGQSIILNTVLPPVDHLNKPLMAGDIILEVELVQTSDGKKLLTSLLLMAKTNIVNEYSPSDVKVISSDVSKKIEMNTSYDILLDVLNNTNSNWKVGDELINAQIVKIDDKGNVIEDNKKEIIPVCAMSDAAPGTVCKFKGVIKSSSVKDENANYAILYTLKDSKTLKDIGLEDIKIVRNDYNQRIVPASAPIETLDKSTNSNMKVIVRNGGNKVWPNTAKVVANWYNDKGEIVGKAGEVLISKKKKIAPGTLYMVDLPVATLGEAGNYNLVCDVDIDGALLSSLDTNRTNDIFVCPVEIK